MSTVLRTQTMRWMGRERTMVLVPAGYSCDGCVFRPSPNSWCLHPLGLMGIGSPIVGCGGGIYSRELPAIRDDENWHSGRVK